MAKYLLASNRFFLIKCLVMLIIGFLLLIVRNADPLVNPIIYTEDGLWTGMSMTHGWLHTFYYAKDGYLVWGNLIALWLSNIDSLFLCGDRLTCLPESIAVTSYIFFAFVAVLAFFATKNYLRMDVRILFFALVIFLPLGHSSNEIFGRLSNIGYYFVFICLILILVRDAQVSVTSKACIDVVLILGMATNPVCIPLILFYLLLALHQHKLKQLPTYFFVKENILLLIGFLIISAIVMVKKLTEQNPAITGQLNIQNLMEVIFARSILYPFIFPYYEALNNLITIILLTLWSCLIGLGFYVSKKETRKILLISISSFLLYLIFTIFMRQSLTEQLNNYSGTFPDRYFMGLNIIIVFITVICLNSVLNSRYKMLSYSVIAFILYLYINNVSFILEYKIPRFPIVMHEKLNDQLCLNSGPNWLDQSASVIISTSAPWSMEVPVKVLQKSVSKLNCKDTFSRFYITDENWNSGISKRDAAFFVINSTLTQKIFSSGKRIELNNGELRDILLTIENGKYLNVYLKGGTLDVRTHGQPNTYIPIK